MHFIPPFCVGEQHFNGWKKHLAEEASSSPDHLTDKAFQWRKYT